jgi:hypothetical protein
LLLAVSFTVLDGKNTAEYVRSDTLWVIIILHPEKCIKFVLLSIGNEALARLIRPKSSPDISIALLAFAAVVFRAELAVYLAALSLVLLLRSKIRFGRLVAVGVISSVCSVCKYSPFTSLVVLTYFGIVLSVSVDSYFWQKWPMWPELHGIYFNVVQGKSSDWGVSILSIHIET